MSDDDLAQFEDSDAGVKWRVRRFSEKAPDDTPRPLTEPEPPWWEKTLAAITAPRRTSR